MKVKVVPAKELCAERIAQQQPRFFLQFHMLVLSGLDGFVKY
jgi:hypothetical protein